METYIDVQFIFDSVRLGLSRSTVILQKADVALRVVFLLFLLCFMLLFRQVPAVNLTLETSELSTIFYGVLCVCGFQPMRIGEIFWINSSE